MEIICKCKVIMTLMLTNSSLTAKHEILIAKDVGEIAQDHLQLKIMHILPTAFAIKNFM
jgi:hypothetical protein